MGRWYKTQHHHQKEWEARGTRGPAQNSGQPWAGGHTAPPAARQPPTLQASNHPNCCCCLSPRTSAAACSPTCSATVTSAPNMSCRRPMSHLEPSDTKICKRGADRRLKSAAYLLHCRAEKWGRAGCPAGMCGVQQLLQGSSTRSLHGAAGAAGTRTQVHPNAAPRRYRPPHAAYLIGLAADLLVQALADGLTQRRRALLRTIPARGHGGVRKVAFSHM